MSNKCLFSLHHKGRVVSKLATILTKKKTMYTEKFKDLVDKSIQFSKKFYSDKNDNRENPFYIGFGNPNSKVLIIGQEKAISKNEINQIKVESVENSIQWQKLILENISDTNYRFYDDTIFKNPLHPYDKKPKKGNTWNQYQLLIENIFPEIKNFEFENSFLIKSFISEINHEVSKKKLGNQRNKERRSFLNHIFFQSFPMTILAIGDYLSRSEIEQLYNVRFEEDKSEEYKKLVIFENKNQKRILIQTRQMSNFFFNTDKRNEYFLKISKELKKYGG